MITKIFEKYTQLKEVLNTFDREGRKKEDEPTLIEAVKVIVKEFLEILDNPESED